MGNALIIKNVDFSANALDTVEIIPEFAFAFLKGGFFQWAYSETNDFPSITTDLQNKMSIAFGVNFNKRKACKYEGYTNIYPYPIPNGAKTITVNCQDMASLIVYYDINSAQTASRDTMFADCAKVVGGETATGGYSNSISSWTYDERTYTIPNNPNINSFTLMLHPKSDSVFDAFDPDNSGVTITFGY